VLRQAEVITALAASRLQCIMVTWTFATLSLLRLSLHNTPSSKRRKKGGGGGRRLKTTRTVHWHL